MAQRLDDLEKGFRESVGKTERELKAARTMVDQVHGKINSIKSAWNEPTPRT